MNNTMENISMNLIHLGLDFDNTIVIYDELFYEYALQKKYIKNNIEKTKIAVRRELINQGREDIFTELQGIVYGKLIAKVPMQKFLAESLKYVLDLGAKVSIVSHKTKYPIFGEKIDLHKASMLWLKNNGFFDNSVIGIKEDDVFFEKTIEDKVSRIHSIGCTHFIDDLEKVLCQINDNVSKIKFGNDGNISEYKCFRNWNDLKLLLLNQPM